MTDGIISTKIKEWFARHDIVLEFAKMLTENADHCIVVGHNGQVVSIFFYFVEEDELDNNNKTATTCTTFEKFLTDDCTVMNSLLFFVKYNIEQRMLKE